ncbi:cation diffusion facilitator family transporter [[Clostridium] aminophilum]|uniref:Cation diffusion facilitator family transporter n=1 Tax=[Clostridium] aminophilum TaxID=1526 RepID=A0A1I0HTY1_9FIRM|nr:cation diffusion facilitator family transporter [[Clostridium] aminophilum]SET86638.1 cation diffusion facilitator family transporter [[Clostridium] aminophilum]
MGSIKEAKEMMEGAEAVHSRDRIIIRTSIIGILANVGLAAFKASVGLFSNSIAIVMDAVNNISDAGSSLITIVGTKLAGREPDKKHPFGYGRIEYLTAMIIAVIVLYAGLKSLEESVKAILHPETPEYSTVSLVIIAAGVLVKIVLGRYVKATGEKVNSHSLINSGQDAMMDSVISASTLAAALVYILTGISLEAWLGALISLVIIKAGIEMLKETLSQILGESVDPELASVIKNTVKSFPQVIGAYDLVLNNYGPDTFNGSVHIEVPDTCTANELDELIRSIQYKVYTEHKVVLTAVGVYSVNTKNDRAAEVERELRHKVMEIPNIRQMHGFYLSETNKTIRFDTVVSFNEKDREGLHRRLNELVETQYPGYTAQIVLDTDFSEQ